MLRVSKGKNFGEKAFITNKPRAATVKTTQDTHFAVMSKKDYEKTLEKIEQNNIKRFLEFFLSIPMFMNWSKRRLII